MDGFWAGTLVFTVTAQQRLSCACLLKPQRHVLGCQASLKSLLASPLQCANYWTPGGPGPNQGTSQLPLLVQHSITDGPVVTIVPDEGEQTTSDFATQHKGILEHRACGIVTLSAAMELVLVPFKAKRDRKVVSAFWGYLVPTGVNLLAARIIGDKMTPVVLDLDETLLVAYTLPKLQGLIEENLKERAAWQEAADGGKRSPDSVAKGDLLNKELAAMRSDEELLTSFTNNDCAQIQGRTGMRRMQAMLEEAILPDGQTVKRPVIRLFNDSIILTRIAPGKKETSMIFRPRPGWPKLKQALEATSSDQKRKYEVYVCTAATQDYAFEAWRVLDTGCTLIPFELLKQRITCVKTHKERKKLSAVLRSKDAIRLPEDAPAAGAPAAVKRTWSSNPLAVIVDDRIDVWEEAAQAQVLRIAAFTPHTDTKLSTTNAQSEAKRHHMEQDIASLALHLATLRSWVYFGITIRLQPLVEDFATKHGQGFWDLDAAADDARSVLPLPARMPELLSRERLDPLSQDEHSASIQENTLRRERLRQAAQQAAAGNKAPQDPRQRGAQAAKPAAATGPQGDVVPQDPRQSAKAAQQQQQQQHHQQQAAVPAGHRPPQNQAAAAGPASGGAGGQAQGAPASGRGGAGRDTRPVDPRKKQRVPAEPQAAGLSMTGLSVEDEDMPDAGAEGRPTLKRKPAGGPGGEPPPAVKPRLARGAAPGEVFGQQREPAGSKGSPGAQQRKRTGWDERPPSPAQQPPQQQPLQQQPLPLGAQAGPAQLGAVLRQQLPTGSELPSSEQLSALLQAVGAASAAPQGVAAADRQPGSLGPGSQPSRQPAAAGQGPLPRPISLPPPMRPQQPRAQPPPQLLPLGQARSGFGGQAPPSHQQAQAQNTGLPLAPLGFGGPQGRRQQAPPPQQPPGTQRPPQQPHLAPLPQPRPRPGAVQPQQRPPQQQPGNLGPQQRPQFAPWPPERGQGHQSREAQHVPQGPPPGPGFTGHGFSGRSTEQHFAPTGPSQLPRPPTLPAPGPPQHRPGLAGQERPQQQQQQQRSAPGAGAGRGRGRQGRGGR